MTDSEKEVTRKMNKAYCPEKQTEENPILEYCKFIVFEKFEEIKIERPEKFGGNLTIKSYKELEEIFSKGDLHPADLKKTVGIYINKLLDPVRNHFKTNKTAAELLKKVESYQVTR